MLSLGEQIYTKAAVLDADGSLYTKSARDLPIRIMGLEPLERHRVGVMPSPNNSVPSAFVLSTAVLLASVRQVVDAQALHFANDLAYSEDMSDALGGLLFKSKFPHNVSCLGANYPDLADLRDLSLAGFKKASPTPSARARLLIMCPAMCSSILRLSSNNAASMQALQDVCDCHVVAMPFVRDVARFVGVFGG